MKNLIAKLKVVLFALLATSSTLVFSSELTLGQVLMVDIQKQIVMVSDYQYRINEFTVLRDYNDKLETRLPLKSLKENTWVALYFEYNEGLKRFMATEIVILPNQIVAEQLRLAAEQD